MFQWDGQALVDSFWNSLSAPFQAWLMQHPLLSWFVLHPIWLLAASLLTLFIFSGLLRAIAGLTEQLWLGLLRLPILLTQWIWRGSALLLRPLMLKANFSSDQPATGPDRFDPLPDHLPNRLTEVLHRLEALHQEETQLIQEIKSLLSAQTSAAENGIKRER